MRVSLYFIFLFLLTSCVNENRVNSNEDVIIEEWNMSPCDSDSDPYNLITNIVSYKQEEDKTYISINFADNCCIEIAPNVSYGYNSIYVQPYTKSLTVSCACICCFTLDLVLLDLPDNEFHVFFKNQHVPF